jgi:hypothetical protein
MPPEVTRVYSPVLLPSMTSSNRSGERPDWVVLCAKEKTDRKRAPITENTSFIYTINV